MRYLLAFAVLIVAVPAWAEDIGETRFVQFSPDGRLAAFCSNRSAKLWDTVTRRKVGELKGHTDDLSALAFSPDGKTLFTAGGDKVVREWDLATNKPKRTFEGHTDGVTSVAVSPDGKTLASAGYDQVVRVWDLGTGKELRQFKGHSCFVLFVAFSPDGKTAVSGGGDNVARLWDVETGKELRKFTGNQDAAKLPANVRSAAFTPDGKRLVTASTDHSVRVYDVESGRELRQCTGHTADMFYVAVSPDGRTLATAGHDGTLRLWDEASGRELKAIECHGPGVMCVGFSPDGRALISGGYDCNVNLWETLTGKLRAEYAPNEKPADKPPEKLTDAEVEALWKALTGEDAAKAYVAVLTLAARPQEAVPFLTKQLKPADGRIDAKQIQRWIRELDDEDFDKREAAQVELKKLGRLAKVPVQEALGKTKSVEMKRRLKEILQALEKDDLPAEQVLEARALEVLERAGTREARKLLEALAGGAAQADRTVQAKAALERLSKRPGQP
jgi:WD40 repeat protein